MSNSLGPDQARRFVGPDMGPNCLQMFSANDKKWLLAGKELNIEQPLDTYFWLKPWLKSILFDS